MTAVFTAPADDARSLIPLAADLPALSDKYARFTAADGPVPLAELPVLSKDDFAAVRADVLARARTRDHGTVIFGTGGTTSEPKLSVVPGDMFIEEICAQWRPLGHDDVLLNCNTGSELGSMNPFYNRLAEQCGAAVVPLGGVGGDKLGRWLDFAADCGVTAIGATPSYLATLLEFCAATGRDTSHFRKVVWTGERFSDHATEVAARLLPDAEYHSVYGSSETWVIGHNGPECDRHTFHPMPYQHVEVDQGRVLITNTHPRCVNPILRYQIGDRGEFVSCPCGRQDPALRILGRMDQQVKFRSILFVPQELADTALADPEVMDVQIAIYESGTPGERMHVRVRLVAGADADALCARLRVRLLEEHYRVSGEVSGDEEGFRVRADAEFSRNERTNKTPLLVREES